MFLLFLPLLISGALGVELIENWECGSKSAWSITEYLSKSSISHCHYAVIDAANLCCKAHDLCYEVHPMRKDFTKEFCDERFRICLHDVSAKNGIFDCKAPMEFFHALVDQLAGGNYRDGTPLDHKTEFAGFVDKHPLELDMQSLLDACKYSKMLVVHCHNTVDKCMQRDHARIKRLLEEESIVTHPYEDCRATMRDCVQTIIDYAPTDTCVAKAESIQKELNIYVKLDEAKHGRAIMEAYPFQAARLIQQCRNSESALTSCYLAFNVCAQTNRREHPKLYSAVWRINIECHHKLDACILAATSGEIGEDCEEARALAVNRIREVDVPPQNSFEIAFLNAAVDLVARKAKEGKNTLVEGVEAVGSGAKKAAHFAGEVATDVKDVVFDAGKAAWNGAKETAGKAWNWVSSPFG